MLAELAGQRSGDGWFRSGDVSELFFELRLPAPQNVSAILGNFREAGLVVSRRLGTGRAFTWSLTPLGHKTVLELVGAIDAARLEPSLAKTVGANFGHAPHTVLPPALAPLGWQDGIRNLLRRSPFETNVLCMTRFQRPQVPEDTIGAVIDVARTALDAHGLRLYLASDAIVDDDLWGNVAAYMWACRFGIALVEDRVGEGVNDNLKIEIGAMLMAGRRCALLKDRSVATLPTDLIGRIFKSVDFDDLGAVGRELHLWAAKDLELGKCPSCPDTTATGSARASRAPVRASVRRTTADDSERTAPQTTYRAR